jgi:hypothetical protein
VKSSNESGQTYAFMAMTPIVDGQEAALRAYIEGIPRAASPFARLPRTHLARWVILDDFHNEKEQPREERLRCRYLIFTSNFDGPLDTYLDELCERLADEAGEIWGRCHGCPKPAAGDALKRYLLHNQIDTRLFFAAYGEATVARVTASLEQRERMIDFAVEAQGLEPDELQRRFRQEFCA